MASGQEGVVIQQLLEGHTSPPLFLNRSRHWQGLRVRKHKSRMLPNLQTIVCFEPKLNLYQTIVCVSSFVNCLLTYTVLELGSSFWNVHSESQVALLREGAFHTHPTSCSHYISSFPAGLLVLCKIFSWH